MISNIITSVRDVKTLQYTQCAIIEDMSPSIVFKNKPDMIARATSKFVDNCSVCMNSSTTLTSCCIQNMIIR